jgi:flagellar basal-body rod protein FlgB
MAGPFDNPFGLSALSLPLREQRLQVLASNLANADTPGFQAQEFDFNAALRDAEAAQRRPLVTPHGGHTDGAAALGALEGGGSYVRARAGLQPSLDGNTVNAETENAAFGRAALEYRASLTFFESRVRGLMTAITGQ